ncbi:DUF1800 domain-containing protein [Sphingomonas psychrolutea]|uniref:DUF1800 domain-containing protein n=1 Tax=Sphingomonas psychrolutea TaxID=1259676 RepID=A0ABQ1GSS8_9SPHN|nr:DUF1800 family protein [Sphingomonas psychrolutea]GGA49638.1 hypothetical protein GCM10011395_20000 [Sphingomonas psychrolutea]
MAEPILDSLEPETSPAEPRAMMPPTPLSGASLSTLAASLALAACSGGGGGAGTTAGGSPTPTPSPTPAPIGAAAASRLLGQATMGATKAEIASVQSLGFNGWITAQFAQPRATSHWDWLVANGYNVAANINNTTGFDPTIWRQMIAEPDQLRQRVGIALSEMMVIGVDGLVLNWKQFAGAAYFDVLLDNAFGNFRTLMGAITTNAAMASFLTFLGNKKGNTTTGAQPDENYARELMQLFTLGLYQLNADGTVKMSGGKPLETYGPADVSGLARVFTGLNLASAVSTTPDRYRVPLIMTASQHESGASSFLGTTIPAGTEGMAAVNLALDAIFAHSNVPPFVSKQLIQKMVTSNPSAAYIGRVSAVFANEGSGVRGDMKAVLRAILTDAEARDVTVVTASNSGKLREPVHRLTGWARAFAATSPSNAWTIGDTTSSSTRLGQSIGHSATVFNFFRPGYTPANTAISTAGLVAPEFQITNELSVVAYINYLQALIANGAGDFKADYSTILTLAGDSQALIDEVNLMLANGQLSAATITAIKGAVDSISNTGATGPSNRVMTAILLAMASPDYLTFR